MTSIDFTPFFRTTVGFDHMIHIMDTALSSKLDSYPPHNIIKLDDDLYRIVMAIAGFSKDELEITLHGNRLFITGISTKSASDGVEYLYKGIANRNFKQQFSLADYVKVGDIILDNGLLNIDLYREIPDEMLPKQLKIQTKDATSVKKLVQTQNEQK